MLGWRQIPAWAKRSYVDLNKIGSFGRNGNQGQPMITGAVYSPISDLVYISSTRVDGQSSKIEAVDTGSFLPVTTIDSTHKFAWNGDHPLESGRLRISRDGKLLLATVSGGVMVYRLDQL